MAGDGVEEKVGVESTMKCVNLVLRQREALGRACARTRTTNNSTVCRSVPHHPRYLLCATTVVYI